MQSKHIQIAGIPLQVEVAISPRDQGTGLSHRGFLPWNQGMLFLYPDDQVRAFWMKNTSIPLSIAFFDNKGAIVHIADMEPDDETWVTSPLSCRGAIEVNQGWFQKNGIQVGDYLELSIPTVIARPNPAQIALEGSEGSSAIVTKIRTAYTITHLISAPIAMGLSYQRNRSLMWAFLAGFVPIPYLVYRFVDRK